MKVSNVFSGAAADPDEWFKGVKGKHRIVFDCTEPKEIFPFAWPKIYMLTNAATGGIGCYCRSCLKTCRYVFCNPGQFVGKI